MLKGHHPSRISCVLFGEASCERGTRASQPKQQDQSQHACKSPKQRHENYNNSDNNRKNANQPRLPPPSPSTHFFLSFRSCAKKINTTTKQTKTQRLSASTSLPLPRAPRAVFRCIFLGFYPLPLPLQFTSVCCPLFLFFFSPLLSLLFIFFLVLFFYFIYLFIFRLASPLSHA